MRIVNVCSSSRCVAGFIGMLLALSATGVNAGSLDAPFAPTTPGSAMFTLQNLCDRLASGTFVEPTVEPGPTMCTLNQIMAAMPTLDDANGAVVADVLASKTFWGLTGGGWGLKTGTATAGANVNGANGQLVINIPNGFYSGSETTTASDSNLAAAHIKSGVTIFGTAGTFTSDGNAAADDLRLNKKAYVAGNLVVGAMPTQILSETSTIVNAGYYAATNLTAVDGDLAIGNIRSTVTIFGIAGDSNVVNTSSGDATVGDLLAGKKAWVDGAEITGSGKSTLVPKTGQTASFATGDDGALQKGAALPSPRFTDNGNGTVTDNLTGLIWLKNANCANAARTWVTALNDVASLNTSGVMNGNSCGDTSNGGNYQTDWRLPNRRELFSLINDAYFSPALSNAAGTGKWTEGDPFTGVQSNDYWSSTAYAPNTRYAWHVFLNGGLMLAGSKARSYSVWPVRGGL